jgi:hypothetical protein
MPATRLSRSPLERTKVVDVEVAAALARKQQRRIRIHRSQPFERVDGSGL